MLDDEFRTEAGEILLSLEVPARLQIVLTNLNPEPVHTARWVAEEYNLRIQIRDNNGSEPKRTDFGKGVLLPPQGSRLRDPILKQGETLTAVLDVRKQYVLTTGTYCGARNRHREKRQRPVAARCPGRPCSDRPASPARSLQGGEDGR